MDETAVLSQEIADYAAAHGLMYAHKEHVGVFEHAPVSLAPTPYPQSQFMRAIELAVPFNNLVEACARSPEWLLETLATVEDQDPFTARLMALQREVIASGETQKIHLGINRSDYMLHLGNDAASSPASAAATQGLLQVELNTIASSFGCLSTKVTALHKHLLPRAPPKFMGTIPDNGAAAGLARGLAFAHREYLKVRLPDSASGNMGTIVAGPPVSSSEAESAAAAAAGGNPATATAAGAAVDPSSSTGDGHETNAASAAPGASSSSFQGGVKRQGEQVPLSTAADVKVLFLVQPGERNVMDQRHLEYELIARSGGCGGLAPSSAATSGAPTPAGAPVLPELQGAPVHVLRATLTDVSKRGIMVADAKGRGLLYLDGHEISVIYFRAGYSPDDYFSENEWRARRLMEHSFAVKCPNVAYHLAGAKKVQQRLAAPGQLEQFVKVADDVTALRAVFAGLYGLENLPPSGENTEGQAAIEAAKQNPDMFVLKPQREGGGNNLFGSELKHALETWPPHALASHILMEKIQPPSFSSTLVRNGHVVTGPCVVELGIYGVYCSGGTKQLNEPAGHLMRAKLQGVDEGGVAAGFACLSSPLLVEDSVLLKPGEGAASNTATTTAAAAALPPLERPSGLKRQRTDADPNAV